MAAARRTKKAKPAEEIAEIEELDTDLELDEDEAEEEAPAPKAKKAKAAKAKVEKPAKVEIAFGTQQLADHINAEAGTTHTPYTLRILLRKLTADGVLKREESEGRARYSFTGPEDEQVVAILEAVKSGADKKAEAERLQGLKDKRAAKKASAAPKAKKSKKADVEPEAVEEDDFDEEIEDI